MATNRRVFLKFACQTAVAIPAVTLLGNAQAQDGMPRIEESDPTAVALGYKHNGEDVDTGKWTQYKPEQNCTNCNLYADASAEWAACPIYPGKLVKGSGWCSAWVARAG